MKRIAVFGASGFVGAHFVERARSGRDEVVPVVHSSGSAWRLARWGLPLRRASLLDKGEIAGAIQGCTHVVNCSRGGDDVMLKGLKNLLEVCTDVGTRGFIHLSSVMVYGDPPSRDSHSETGTVPDGLTGYAATKLQQDKMVMSAAPNLPSAILCPPNITGPYSHYLLNILAAIKNGEFALMGDGSAPCVVVDVDNLAHAIERAVEHCTTAPRRLFITDDEPTSWAMVTKPLLEFAGVGELASISEADLRALQAGARRAPQASPLRSLKHLVSSDVRQALRNDPLLARFDVALRGAVAKLGAGVENKLRLSIEGPPPVPRPAPGPMLNVTLCGQQLRGVRHSNEAAKQLIGYRPPRTFEESVATFRRWYRGHLGMDTPFWPLLKMLHR